MEYRTERSEGGYAAKALVTAAERVTIDPPETVEGSDKERPRSGSPTSCPPWQLGTADACGRQHGWGCHPDIPPVSRWHHSDSAVLSLCHRSASRRRKRPRHTGCAAAWSSGSCDLWPPRSAGRHAAGSRRPTARATSTARRRTVRPRGSPGPSVAVWHAGSGDELCRRFVLGRCGACPEGDNRRFTLGVGLGRVPPRSPCRVQTRDVS